MALSKGKRRLQGCLLLLILFAHILLGLGQSIALAYESWIPPEEKLAAVADILALLAETIGKGEQHRLATPPFLADLKDILAGLQSQSAAVRFPEYVSVFEEDQPQVLIAREEPGQQKEGLPSQDVQETSSELSWGAEPEEIDAKYRGDVQAQAIVAGSMVELGVDGIPKLIPFLQAEEGAAVAAVEALGKIGAREGTAPLMEALSHPSPRVQKAVVNALEQMGPKAAEAAPALQAVLVDLDPQSAPTYLERDILRALAAIGEPPDPATLPALIKRLALSDYMGGNEAREILSRGDAGTVQGLAAALPSSQGNGAIGILMTLGMMGPRAEGAIPALLSTLTDSNENIRRQGVNALAKVGQASPEAADGLCWALTDRNEAVVEAAAYGLLRCSRRDEAVLQAVRQALKDHGGNTRITNPLARILGSYGPTVISELEGMIKQGEPWSQIGILALRQMKAEGLVPLLVDLYPNEGPALQREIIAALGAMPTDRGLETVLGALRSEDRSVREAAASALASWPDLPPGAKAELRALIDDDSSKVAAEAVRSLAATQDPEMVPVLCQTLASRKGDVQLAAAEGLASMGSAAVGELTARLSSADVQTRGVATAVLGMMGAQAAPAVPDLYQLSVNDGDEKVRETADRALWAIWSLEGMELPAIPMPSFSGLEELMDQDWELAALAARELVRSIIGEMSMEETRLFEAQWQPFFAYPSQELVDYLKVLSPLLAQFVALRSQMVETGANYQGILTSAWTAHGCGDEEAFQLALVTAEHLMTTILAYQRQLAKLSGVIMELLPPPEPQELQAKARRRHQEALDLLAGGDLADLERDAWSGGEYWVLVDTIADVKQGHTAIDWWAGPADRGIAFSGGDGMIAGSEMATGGDLGKETYSVSGDVRWTPPPLVLADEGRLSLPMKVSVSFAMTPKERQWLTSGAGLSIRLGGTPWRTWRAGGPPIQQYDGTKRDPPDKVSDDEEIWLPLSELWVYEQEGHGPRFQLQFYAVSPGGMGTFTYVYEKMLLGEDGVQELVDADRERARARKQGEEQSMAEYLAQAEAMGNRINAIAYHNEQARYFQDQAARLKEEIAGTTDPNVLGSLQWQLLVTEANWQGELDQASTASTGQWVRTRTLYDDYVSMRMVEQGLEMAAQAASTQRILDGLPRLIANAPPELQADLRDFVNRNLDPKDPDRMRALVEAVGNQVQGYWEGEAARHEEAAVVAEEKMFYAQMGKVAVGAVVTAGAAPLAAGLGMSAQSMAWAPLAARITFGGATGFVEGGLGEALKQSVAWSHQVGYLATEANDGFASQTGFQSGLTEAAWRAGQAYLYGKTFEYGIQLGGRLLTKAFGPGVHKPIFGMSPRPSLQEQFDANLYNQEMTNAKSLVRSWQDKQFEVARLSSSGVGSRELDRARQELRQLVTSINASYEAKWLLKHQAGPHVQRMFNQEITQVYQGVMPQYYRNLEAMGYDTSNLQFDTIRNASSAGSVGMDYDLRLIEHGPITIHKHGAVVDRFQFMEDAQQAWNKAYFTTTHYSAKRSDIHVTTLVHPEAFADVNLLSKSIDFKQISPGHIQQAGDVFRTKAQMSYDSTTSEIARVQRVSRDIHKELENKVLPYFDYRIKQEALRGNSRHVQKLQSVKKYWSDVHRQVDIIGRQETNPYEILRRQKQLELLTGHKAVDVMDQMAVHFEALGKLY
ncbi:MAG: HEAT repeat domain-containing protein [Limnochordia bacterium]|jgi:HEAT repeat protein